MDTDAGSRGLLIQYEPSKQFRCLNFDRAGTRGVATPAVDICQNDVMQLSLLMKH